MENENYNAKCSKCGYIFEADLNEKEVKCPLCSELNDTEKSSGLFKETFKDYRPKRKTTLRMAIDLAIFGVSLAALIFVLYFVISLIIGLANQ